MSEAAVRVRPLPPQAHTARKWRIHEVAADFRLEDVWALPTPGGPDDMTRLVGQFLKEEDERDFPLPYRVLVAIRWWLGSLLGLDDEKTGLGERVESVRERLPSDLRDAYCPKAPGAQLQPVYLTRDEYVAEIANSTVHALLHLGWVEDASVPGGHRGQLAILVKPNGWFGAAYMAFIKPFRYAIVYPALLRTIGRRWAAERVAAP